MTNTSEMTNDYVFVGDIIFSGILKNMSPKMEYFDSNNKDILEVLLHGSSKGYETSDSIQKTFESAKECGRSVVMFDFPFIERREVFAPEKNRDEDTEALKSVLGKVGASEYKKVRLIGKSFGGVVATDYLNSLILAEQKKYELAVLGYVPGATKIDKLLSKVEIFQGSEDSYGNAGKVREDLANSEKRDITVHEISGSDHSFKCPETGESHFDKVLELLFINHSVEKDKLDKCCKKAPEIEPVVQKFDYDCGWAAVNDLLLILHREDVLKTDLYSRLEVDPINGTRSQNIKRLFNEERIEYIETSGASMKDLISRLGMGYVCLVGYQAWGSDEEMDALESGHYSIVFNVDEEGVWVLDPTIENEEVPGAGRGVVCYTKEVFDKRWIDKGTEGEIYDHWMMAVR